MCGIGMRLIISFDNGQEEQREGGVYICVRVCVCRKDIFW